MEDAKMQTHNLNNQTIPDGHQQRDGKAHEEVFFVFYFHLLVFVKGVEN